MIWILLACLVIGIAGALLGSYLPYYLTRRGSRVSKAVKIATITTGVFLSIALIPVALLVIGLAGLLGYVGIIVLALYFLVQYLLPPYVFAAGTLKIEPGSNYSWVSDLAQSIARRMNYKKKFEVRIADVEVPNAFAVGNIFKRVIVVHKGLLKILDKDELEAVLAHEMGHLAHRDNSYMLATSFTPMATYIIGTAMLFLGYAFIAGAARSREGGFVAGLIGLGMIALGAVITVLAIIVNLAVLAFSRIREHMADLYSVRATGGDAIVRALVKIENAVVGHRSSRSLPVKPSIRNMLYIVPQLAESSPSLSSILSTHPPTHVRIYIVKKYLEELSSGKKTP